MAKIASELTVADVAKLKNRLEQRIALDIANALREFEGASGFTPSDISVHLVAVHLVGQPRPDYTVDRVEATLNLP